MQFTLALIKLGVLIKRVESSLVVLKLKSLVFEFMPAIL